MKSQKSEFQTIKWQPISKTTHLELVNSFLKLFYLKKTGESLYNFRNFVDFKYIVPIYF